MHKTPDESLNNPPQTHTRSKGNPSHTLLSRQNPRDGRGLERRGVLARGVRLRVRVRLDLRVRVRDGRLEVDDLGLVPAGRKDVYILSLKGDFHFIYCHLRVILTLYIVIEG